MNFFFIIDLYVLVIMIGSQILMTVRSFTLASVMVNLGWVFVQERLSSTMPQVFVMIQILFQDGNPFFLKLDFFKKNVASPLHCLFSAKIFGKTKKRKNCKTITTTITHKLPSTQLRASSITYRLLKIKDTMLNM